MPSRREFIQAGFVASVVPVAFPSRLAASVGAVADSCEQPSHRLSRLVCDLRSRHSVDVAREAARLGVSVVPTLGDITDFWLTDLSTAWRTSPVAIAGLTAHGPLFCLERLAWDHGLRVVFRGVHRFHDSRHVEHALAGPFRTVASAHSALMRDDWPVHVARLLNSCGDTPDTASTTVRSVLTNDCAGDIDDTLFSWVIAPRQAPRQTPGQA